MVKKSDLVKGNFEYTGKSKPITLERCIKYVMDRLREYDTDMGKKSGIKESPYNSKIIMEVEKGKFVEIPNEVQNEAVRKWLAEKGFVDDNDNDDFIDDTDTNIDESVSVNKKRTVKTKNNFITLLPLLLMIIVILLVSYYCLKKYIKIEFL